MARARNRVGKPFLLQNEKYRDAPVMNVSWYGPTAAGSAAYYRIQGPSLLIEYAPQGGTSHIHTIFRDPTNEYGKAWTKS